MKTRKFLFAVALIFTLSSCSPTGLIETPTPSATIQAVTPTFIITPAPTATPKLDTPTPEPTAIIGTIVKVGDKAPMEAWEKGSLKFASDKLLEKVYEQGQNVYGWPDKNGGAIDGIYGNRAMLPLPDQIQSPTGATLTRGADAIEGYLATYTDGTEVRYLLSKVPLKGDVVVLTADAKGNQYPQVYQLKSDGTILETQKIDFGEEDKPDTIITRNVSNDVHLIMQRNGKMLYYDANLGWRETTTSIFDNIILKDLPKNYTIIKEDGVWRVKVDGEDWAVANPIYDEYWMRLEDLTEGHTDITDEYITEHKLGPMVIAGHNGQPNKEITDYRIFKENSSGVIKVIDRYGCQVGRPLVYYDKDKKIDITAPDTLLYLAQIQSGDIFQKPVKIWVQFTSDKYNPLDGLAVRFVEPGDSGYEPHYYDDDLHPKLGLEDNPLKNLTSEELTISSPADLLWTLYLKRWIVNKLEKTNPKKFTMDQFKSATSDQIICAQKGVASSFCYSSYSSEINIHFTDPKTYNNIKYSNEFSAIGYNFVFITSPKAYYDLDTELVDAEKLSSYRIFQFSVLPYSNPDEKLAIYSLAALPFLANHPLFTFVP